MVLSKETLLAATLERERVEVLGDFVFVRGMTGTERDGWEQSILYHKKKSKNDSYDHFRASLVVRTVCDESGTRLFDDKEIPKVSGMPAAVLDVLYGVAARMSGITKEDAEKLGEDSTASEDSISDSPDT